MMPNLGYYRRKDVSVFMEWDFFKKIKVQTEEKEQKNETFFQDPEKVDCKVIDTEVVTEQDNSKVLMDENEELKKIIQQKDKELDELKKLLKENTAEKNEKQEGNYNSNTLQEMQHMLAEIKNGLCFENAELISLLDKTENRLQRRDAEVQSFQEDYYRKTITPCIRQFIALGDMMRKVIDEVPEEADEQYFEVQFGKIIESIDYILRDFSFEIYQEGVYGMNYNPQKQDVVAYKETDNQELDKKVSRSLNPGYIWTLPYIIKAKANGEQLPLKSYELIFRKEQVETFKFK